MSSRVRVWAALGLSLWFLVACGNDSDNQPPVFTEAPAEATARVGQTLEVTFMASDPDGDSVTFGVEDGPEGVSVASSGGAGVLSWAPLASDAAPGGRGVSMVVVASDGQGGVARHDFRVQVESSDSAPQFTTSNQRILDLSLSDTLETTVEVKDDDSLSVDFILVDGPSNMRLEQLDAKIARLRWTPNLEQITEKLLWSATIKADDTMGGVATQVLNVILIGVEPEGCEGIGEPPSVAHTPLEDQKGAGDYRVEAVVADEGVVKEVSLFWTLGDPSDAGGYEAARMIDQGDGRYATNLPNPTAGLDEPVVVSYRVCASDDDDLAGDTCDHVVCAPESGTFQFQAIPEEDQPPVCAADLYEPDGTLEEASILEDGDRIGDLTWCEDVDYFAVDMFLGDRLRVEALGVEGEVTPRLRLFEPDGETLADDSGVVGDGTVRQTALWSGFYFVEVSSDQQTPYGLRVDVCENDLDDPNDFPDLAAPIDDGLVLNAILCPGERDWFVVSVPFGSDGLIDIEVLVEGPFEGDISAELAVSLYASDGTTLLAQGLGQESVVVLQREVSGSGDYLLVVDSLVDVGASVPYGIIAITE